MHAKDYNVTLCRKVFIGALNAAYIENVLRSITAKKIKNHT